MRSRSCCLSPPSVNHYWRNLPGETVKDTAGKVLSKRRGVTTISRGGRDYRREVKLKLLQSSVYADLRKGSAEWRRVRIIANPPDRRARDLDNLLKSLLDALAAREEKGGVEVGVILDDAQLDEINIERRDVVRGGQVTVTLSK